MELERISSFRQSEPKIQVDTTSESTLPTRGPEAPLLIPPIHLASTVRPPKGTSTEGEGDLRGRTNYGITKERITQVQSSGTWRNQGPVRVKNPPGNGGGGDSSGGTSGDQRFQMKVEVLQEEVIIRQEEGEMMILTLVMMGVGMILLPLTPLPQEKENIKVLNMSMYFKDLLGQKAKRANLDKQEEMAEMGRILP